MRFEIKSFHELTVSELYAMLRLRERVFIVEQSCPYQDLDDTDQKALHVFLYEEEKLAAYTRIFRSGIKYPEASIGRVVTSPAHRGKGYGEKVMKASIEELLRIGEPHIVLSSQAYAEKFYEKLGFKRTEKEPYLEDDIPHVEMEFRGVLEDE